MARIRILMDNTAAAPGFGFQWGLAMAVELDDGRLWLWDTGLDGLFLETAAKLGVDVRRADGLALSHGHYDHTGGLQALFDAGFRAPVFAHPDIVRTRYGWDEKKGELLSIGISGLIPEFRAVTGSLRLAPGLTMLSDIPRADGQYQAVKTFCYDLDRSEPDPVADDASLVLDTARGPVLILGCCHSGLANTLDAARLRLGIQRFHAVLGGLHLYNAPPEAVEETVQALRDCGASLVAAGHCTGDAPLVALADRLDCEVLPLGTGRVFGF